MAAGGLRHCAGALFCWRGYCDSRKVPFLPLRRVLNRKLDKMALRTYIFE